MGTEGVDRAEEAIVGVMKVADARLLAWVPAACQAPSVVDALMRAAVEPEVNSNVRAYIATAGSFAVGEADSLVRDRPDEIPFSDWEATLEAIALNARDLGGLGQSGLREFQMRMMSWSDAIWSAATESIDDASNLLAFQVLGALAQGSQSGFTGANFALAAMMDELGVVDLLDG